MKKLFLFLTLLIAGITANAQYSPSNNLNYVKLLKVPPVGAVEDSVLVYSGSDSFVKMRPSSVLIGKATATKTGTIKTDITESDPVVYTKNTTDELLDLKTTLSAGAFSGFTLTNNGNGTVDISSGIAYLRATNDPYAPIIKYPIAAVTNLALTDNANNYVLVDYNGGSPTLTVTTNGSTINTQTNSLAFLIARVGNNLDYLSLVGQNVDPNAKLRVRFLNQEGIRRASGAVLGFSNRNLTLTSSVLFSGLIRINAVAFNTASPDTFTLAYNNGSTWTRTTGQTQVNNTEYNVSGTLTTMPNNTFRTDYVYLLPNNPSKLYVIMGNTTYNSLTLAKAAPRPSILPVELQAIGLEVGRLFIEKNSATIAEVQSSFANDFIGAPVPEHNSLTGLQGGTSGEYNHLTNAQIALVNGSEQVANKQNSLTVDGTGVKFPTVDAINKRINWLSIKEYGAVGDGLTDESTAIQNTINASATTYIPAGTYIINATLSIPSNHTLIFEEGSKFKSKTGLNAWMMTNSDHIGGNTNINIIGGEFDGNKSGQTPFLAVLYFDKISNSNFDKLYIHDGKGHPVVDDFNGALTLANSSFVSVNDSKSENNNGTAFIIMSSDHINVKGGFYSNNGCTGVGWYDSPYCSAIGVTAENNTTASGISANGFYSTVVGNNLKGNKYNINVGHTTPVEQYASYSTVTGNTSVNGDYGINLQTGQVGVILSGNNVYGNGTDYVADLSTLNLNYFHKGISIGNQNPNPNASVNIGANFNSVPSNTHMILQGGKAIRFTGEDGNADQGAYIFGGNNFIGIGSRTGGVNLDGISVTDGKVLSSSIKIQGGASLPTNRPELELTTVGSDVNYRNWAIINNDLSVGDFSILRSNLKDGDPLTNGVSLLNITSDRTRLKRLFLEDADYTTIKYNATSVNTNARNWSISTNSQDFGDFEIRQSSSQGGGTDYDQGAQRFYISRNGDGTFNGNLSATSFNGGATLTGTPTAPTATAGTNTTQIATTAFVMENARPYRVYTAIVSDSGSSTPNSTVLENTTGGTISWSDTNAGYYQATISGASFTSNKTFNQSTIATGATSSTADITSSTTIRFYAWNGTSTVDGSTMNIEIRIYP